MIELSLDSVDNKNNELTEIKLEKIVSEIKESIPEDIKGLDTSQLEYMHKQLANLPYLSQTEFSELLYPQGQSLGMIMIDTEKIVGSISPAFTNWSTEYNDRKGRAVSVAKQLINPTEESIDNVFHIKDPRLGIKLKELPTPEGSLFFVIDGSHRVAGCKLAGVPKIPALVERVPEIKKISTYSTDLKSDWEKRIQSGLIKGSIQEVIDDYGEKSFVLKIDSQILPWMYLPKNRIVNLNKFYLEHFPNAKDLISLSDGKTISREVLIDENEFSKYIFDRGGE